MSGLELIAQQFHFIRPWWLLAIPLALVLHWWVRRRHRPRRRQFAGIAPHLEKALSVGSANRLHILPIDGVTLTTILLILAGAGPTWSRVPNPLVSQVAPLAIALKVDDSMQAGDIAPSRLERAKIELLDLLALRAGGRTGLIAYAGTAHRVVPLTEDNAILKPFLESLTPAVMPSDGADATAALALASATLSSEPAKGAILFVLDDLNRSDLTAIAQHRAAGGASLVFFSVAPQAVVDRLSELIDSEVIAVSADDADTRELDRRIASAYQAALSADERQAWDDRGWLLLWPAALLTLLCFRRGWTMPWAVATIVAGMAGPANADGVIGWFLTADQQGRMAFDDKRLGDAAELFSDPQWRAYALYRAGRYEDAAQAFARLDDASSAFAAGMAHIKSRGYRDAIKAFERALSLDPDYVPAARNLEIAKVILDYVEKAREQSDTGEEGGIGADEVVYDNEAGRGVETTITGDQEANVLSTDQWMRSVDSRAADFLRARFALEAAKEP